MSVAKRLDGKITIITGAASGMGKAAVERFLDEGATVVALDIVQDGLDRLAIPAQRGRSELADVTDGGAVKDVVDRTVKDYGRLDVYYNNAGIAQSASGVEDTAFSDWQQIIDVNLTAAFSGGTSCRAAHAGPEVRLLPDYRVHLWDASAAQSARLQRVEVRRDRLGQGARSRGRR